MRSPKGVAITGLKQKLLAEPGHALEISDEREALIQASIANDPDNPEITEAEFAEMRPASEMLPPALYAKLVSRGRPKAEVTKVPVKLRLDPVIVDSFKSTGKGWQTRMNDVLHLFASKPLGKPVTIGEVFKVTPTATGFTVEWRDTTEQLPSGPPGRRTRSSRAPA